MALALKCLAEPAGVTEMALWHLLILICVALPIGTSLSSARYANVGSSGYALAVAVGVAVGACCGWVMYSTHRMVMSKLQRRSHAEVSLAKQEWYFRGFYLAKILWVAFAGFLGFWLSFASLRIVF